MRLLGGKDVYRLLEGRSLSEGDLARVASCYLPLIGATGMGVYAYLHAQVQLFNGNRFFDSAFNETGLNPDQFSSGLSLLEGVGLIRAYAIETGDPAYLLVVYPPLSYNGFFANDVLSRKLRETLGQANYDLLKPKLFVGDLNVSGYKEITTSFAGAFYDKAENQGIAYSFDKSKFADGMLSRGFQIRVLDDQEVAFCASMAEFYSLDSEVTGQVAAESLVPSRPFGQKLNRQAFEAKLSEISNLAYLRKPMEEAEKSMVGNNSQRAEAIRQYDNMTPREFLSWRQGGGRISTADENLLKALREMGLPNPICNALLAFALETNDNSLPSKYVEMLAGIIKRNGIKTSRDTLEFLRSRDKKLKEGRQNNRPVSHPTGQKVSTRPAEESQSSKNVTSQDNGEVSDEELEAALRKIYGDDDDD